MPCNEELTLDDLVYIIATLPIAEEQINMLLELVEKEKMGTDKHPSLPLTKAFPRREGDYLIINQTRLHIDNGRFSVKDHAYVSHKARPDSGGHKQHGHTITRRDHETKTSHIEGIRTPNEPGKQGQWVVRDGHVVPIDEDE